MDAIKEAAIKAERNGLEFDPWFAEVNRICIRLFGIGVDDLPDWHWAEAHEDGLTPRDAFDEMHEDTFGGSFDEINGQFGVGS